MLYPLELRALNGLCATNLQPRVKSHAACFRCFGLPRPQRPWQAPAAILPSDPSQDRDLWIHNLVAPIDRIRLSPHASHLGVMSEIGTMLPQLTSDSSGKQYLTVPFPATVFATGQFMT